MPQDVPNAIAHPLKFQLAKPGRSQSGFFSKSKSSRENTLRLMGNYESLDDNCANARFSEASYENENQRDVFNIGRTSNDLTDSNGSP